MGVCVLKSLADREESGWVGGLAVGSGTRGREMIQPLPTSPSFFVRLLFSLFPSLSIGA